MSIILGQRSLSRLEGVHPNLIRVVKRAAEIAAPINDFTVLEGVRSKEQCMVNYGKGRNAAQLAAKGIPAKYALPGAPKVTWLSNPFNSKHCIQSDGYGHAVDLVPYPIDWTNYGRFDRMGTIVLAAAEKEGVDIRWGADWDDDGNLRERGETDSPHFELVA